MKPDKTTINKIPEFPYCEKCKGKGRVGMVIGFEWASVHSRRKIIRHRRLYDFDRRAESFPGDHIQTVDTSAFCQCEKGQWLHEANGSDGLTLSDVEFTEGYKETRYVE